MNTTLITAAIITTFAIFGTSSTGNGKTPTITPEQWETQCMGWSSEIIEISGALHEATRETGTNISEELYRLEDSSQERCLLGLNADQQEARAIESDIAQVAAEVEKLIVAKKGSTSAERVLTAALLKLVRSQIKIEPTIIQG